MSVRRKLAVLAAFVAGLWLLLFVAAHNPSLALLVGGNLVITWAACAGEDQPTVERQAELDRPEVQR